MNVTDKIPKLPKWAQNHIAGLERTIREKQQRIDYLGGESKSMIYWGDMSMGQDRHQIPNRESVYFNFSENDLDHIAVSLRDGYLDINSCCGMHLLPRASNSIYVVATEIRGKK